MASEALRAVSDPRKYVEVTIANGASLSDAATLGGYRVAAIEMPAAWTAAGLTFQGSLDGTTYQNVYDDTGTEGSVTTAASRDVGLTAALQLLLAPWRFLKVRSGTSGAAVNQGADRTIRLLLVPA